MLWAVFQNSILFEAAVWLHVSQTVLGWEAEEYVDIGVLQVINFNLLCEDSLLRYQQTYGLVSSVLTNSADLAGILRVRTRQEPLAVGRSQLLRVTLLPGLSRWLFGFYAVCAAINLVPALLSPLQGVTPGSSREELVWAVQHHFQYQEVRALSIRVVGCAEHKSPKWIIHVMFRRYHPKGSNPRTSDLSPRWKTACAAAGSTTADPAGMHLTLGRVVPACIHYYPVATRSCCCLHLNDPRLLMRAACCTALCKL